MILEKYTRADAALYERVVFNEQAMNMNLGRVFTAEEAELFFQAVLEINSLELCLGFYKVFVQNELGRDYIGMGALNKNEQYDAVELEYMLLPQYWNHGYGGELVRELIKMAAEGQSGSKLIAITDPKNLFSKRILMKNGFEFVKEYQNDDGEPAELYQRRK